MSAIYMNMTIAFMASLTGMMMYRSHMMSSLLCLEGMMLSMFVMASLITLNSHYTLSYTIPLVLLVFSACEAAMGLALLVLVSNTYGSDYVQNLNLLRC
ncbi:NADH dehydrogenase subunit 4L (mitochondrion) [Fukomys damarensis]|uniref:NADH-ubiquinone oxidoreductase chain 4L n=2 Tax=Bathyergidae TaxID=10167 RepID=G5CPH3_HETGA|nr:NADH dehydrogenase subunit 4L [Fukomys damarensis]AEM23560.1 NADH dehydrogenase subunit 4L [Heterocephalus glaber]AKU70851.1 NADH dehydrogenase subunit 4L [Fukomys damarensis]